MADATTTKTLLGVFIRARRDRLGLSIRALARASDLSSSFIHHLETGKETNPSLNTMVSISAALGVSVVLMVRAAIEEAS